MVTIGEICPSRKCTIPSPTAGPAQRISRLPVVESQRLRLTEAYDPAHGTWQTMAPMPTGRHGLGSAVVHERIHVISGGPTPGGSFSDLNEVFIPPDPVTSKPGGRAQPDRSER